MAKRAPVFVALSLSLSAPSCVSGGEVPTLTVPDTGTDWVIYGTAGVMRSVSPQSVHVARTSDIKTAMLRPDNLGPGDIDMFFAGIKAEDLGGGITPDKLVFVDKTDERAHTLPPLYNTQVLVRPGPWNAKSGLVATDDPALAADSTKERKDRLMMLLQDLAIQDPCEPMAMPIHTNEITADAVTHIRTLSSGDTYVAINATGRAVIARIPKGAENPVPITVSTGTTAIMPNEVVSIADLGDTEMQDQSGVTVPGEIVVNFVGAFGHGAGQVEFWNATKRSYQVDTPMPPPSSNVQPDLFAGVRHVMLNGMPSICAYGDVILNNVGALFCKPKNGAAWQVAGAFRNAIEIVGMLPDTPSGMRALALDVAGTIYVPQGSMFKPVVQAEVNSGCSPPCASFQTAAIPPGGSGANHLRAIIAGSGASVLAVRDDQTSVQLESVGAVAAALFAEERAQGMKPARFTTSAFDPTGAVWLATGEGPLLLRVTPDLASATRICLPRAAQGMGITSLALDADGRLIMGLTPALLGFGRWQ